MQIHNFNLIAQKMKILFLIIFIIFFAFKVFGHGTIIIQNVEHEKGEIDVKIYISKKTFITTQQNRTFCNFLNRSILSSWLIFRAGSANNVS